MVHNKICYGVVVLREGLVLLRVWLSWWGQREELMHLLRQGSDGVRLPSHKDAWISKCSSVGGIKAADLCPVCWPSRGSSHWWVSFTSHLRPPSSPISPRQIFYKDFIMHLAKQAGHCSNTEGSDPALWICTRIKEAVNGPLLSCHLSSGSAWVKVTWAVVATSPTRAGETGNLLLCMQGRCCVPAWPPKLLCAPRDYSKLVYNFGQ